MGRNQKAMMVGLGIVMFGWAHPSAASTIGITISGGATNLTVVDTVIGWQLHANSTVTADSLGMWDEGDDGFANGGSTQVGLWTTGGVLLASTTVTSSDPLSNGFRFHAIGGVTLTAGTDYIVAGLLPAPDIYRLSATVVSSPAISWVDSRAVNTSTLDFPTQFQGNNGGWFGANLTYSEAVPEPTTLALFGLGVGGLRLLRRKKA